MISAHSSVSPQPQRHIIAVIADPFTPNGLTVEEHQRAGGPLEWDAAEVEFYLDPGQQGGSYIEGHKLRKQLYGQARAERQRPRLPTRQPSPHPR